MRHVRRTPLQLAARARAGLSLIEVMIAIAVLAIGVSSVFAHYITLYQLRGSTKGLGQVQDVMRSVFERIVAADGAILNTVAPVNSEYVYLWSVPRYEDFTDVNNDGIDDALRGVYNPPMTEADLLNPAFGPLLIDPVNVDDLRVYVEYYRGDRDDNGSPTVPGDDLPGMLDTALINDPGEFTARFADPAIRDLCRLDPALPPLEQVPFDKTVLIRVLVVGGGRRAELFTAKRNLPVLEE